MASTLTCRAFADFLSRRSEHLDDAIIHDITPLMGWIGHVETGTFKAEDGVSHTYDRFNRVMPDLSQPWSDVTATSCIGTPCDPNEVKIGFGFTRDSYSLQQISYATDLFCFDLIMSADRAVQQFAWIVETLRDAASMISSNRLKNEAFRKSGFHWSIQADGTLLPFVYSAADESGDLIQYIPHTAAGALALPGGKITTRMLQRQVSGQILRGALGKNPYGTPPLLEFVTDADTLQELREDSTVTDHWRYQDFDLGSKEFYQYGWSGRIGNYGVRVDPHQIRFQFNGNTLNRVFPYVNTAAFLGIKGDPNDAWINAPVCVHFIWHRRAMKSLVAESKQINPKMPFAARDFAGKWGWAMDNLVCKDPITGALSPVDNKRRNKGQFYADWKLATQKQYPEFAEVFLALREPPCVVGAVPCAATPAYVPQEYK